jgi:hypothetical protein
MDRLSLQSLALAVLLASFGTAPSVWAGSVEPAAIPPGTKITMANWERYKQFMPDGMVVLFEGRSFWKMPPDIEIDVEPTIINPLPKNYMAATEKYGSQVKLVSLPDGGFTLNGYVAGIPFQNPQEPHRGWKILANLWYRYLPHLIVATQDNMASLCSQDSHGNIACTQTSFVYRQLQHNTDPGTPMVEPEAGPRDYTEWSMVLEPEELRYRASLTIFYSDLTRPEDIYLFVPELRRVLRGSTASRCAPAFGSDLTADDLRFGFNGNITKFDAKMLGERQILALVDYGDEAGKYPSAYYMPLGWPKPQWSKWQVRDVYVIDVRRIPSHAAGYCYGRRVMYVDKTSWAPLWEDIYDNRMQLWKIFNIMPRTRVVPGVGPQLASGSQITHAWDLEREHLTHFGNIDPQGRDSYVNSEVPENFRSISRYCGPAGLDEIMR